MLEHKWIRVYLFGDYWIIQNKQVSEIEVNSRKLNITDVTAMIN